MFYLPHVRRIAKLEAELEVNEWLRNLRAKHGPFKTIDTPRPGAYIKFKEERQ